MYHRVAYELCWCMRWCSCSSPCPPGGEAATWSGCDAFQREQERGPGVSSSGVSSPGVVSPVPRAVRYGDRTDQPRGT